MVVVVYLNDYYRYSLISDLRRKLTKFPNPELIEELDTPTHRSVVLVQSDNVDPSTYELSGGHAFLVLIGPTKNTILAIDNQPAGLTDILLHMQTVLGSSWNHGQSNIPSFELPHDKLCCIRSLANAVTFLKSGSWPQGTTEEQMLQIHNVYKSIKHSI